MTREQCLAELAGDHESLTPEEVKRRDALRARLTELDVAALKARPLTPTRARMARARQEHARQVAATLRRHHWRDERLIARVLVAQGIRTPNRLARVCEVRAAQAPRREARHIVAGRARRTVARASSASRSGPSSDGPAPSPRGGDAA